MLKQLCTFRIIFAISCITRRVWSVHVCCPSVSELTSHRHRIALHSIALHCIVAVIAFQRKLNPHYTNLLCISTWDQIVGRIGFDRVCIIHCSISILHFTLLCTLHCVHVFLAHCALHFINTMQSPVFHCIVSHFIAPSTDQREPKQHRV